MTTFNTCNHVSIEQLSFPIARFRLRFVESASNNSPMASLSGAGYLGSAWRGAFGHALKQTVCITNLPVCDNCSLLHSCPYPNLFESRTPSNAAKLSLYPRTPVPYVLEPSDPNFDSHDTTYNLGLVLFGTAIDSYPYVIHAFQAAGQRGLTKKRIKLDLLDVQIEKSASGTSHWQTVYVPGQSLVSPTFVNEWVLPDLTPNVRIRLISPLRLKFKEQLVGETQFVFRAFAASLLRRISLLTYFFTDRPLEIDFAAMLQHAESIRVSSKELRWQDWKRRSSRQKMNIQMGGLVGSFELNQDDLEPFLPYLWLGQWTHVGKGCAMGLGRYILQPSSTTHGGKNSFQVPDAPNRL